MSVKQKTLEVLENHRGEYISGGELACMLQVSRNAVWKAIKSLEQEGYAIDAVKNRGYRLAECNDILSEQSIQKYLLDNNGTFRLQVEKCVDSTNEMVKLQALQGAKEGLVVIAEEQTCGKEKSGRVFYSPKGTGIYMSILLRPEVKVEQALSITTAAAVAVARSIEFVSSRKAEIRWVNDVYCDNKKVCGILTEASCNIETSKLDYVVLGIGIHVKMPKLGLPKEMSNGTDYVFKQTETDVRSQLVAEVLKQFWAFYLNLDEKAFLEEYKERSCLIGKDILIEKKDGDKEGRAIAITEQCHLLVQLQDGGVEELSAGTVRLK